MNKEDLAAELDNAIQEFNGIMNQKNTEYSQLNYCEDAIIMMDELGRQTSELANKFRDAIIKYLN